MLRSIAPRIGARLTLGLVGVRHCGTSTVNGQPPIAFQSNPVPSLAVPTPAVQQPVLIEKVGAPAAQVASEPLTPLAQQAESLIAATHPNEPTPANLELQRRVTTFVAQGNRSVKSVFKAKKLMPTKSNKIAKNKTAVKPKKFVKKVVTKATKTVKKAQKIVKKARKSVKKVQKTVKKAQKTVKKAQKKAQKTAKKVQKTAKIVKKATKKSTKK
eukprot:CAMPEP_0176434238 /NCGR_PEP_ID=MMETSP0127-20121128/16549_1 /TAXON_ID=938130 /ORGANISM="Platyophrya macrostoma, Strain WH" /LENGTH=213 /DNA_ID=CAMNT_0017816919 /DNA_START=22 /DNA_END=663 /DNA_ORIENTATION=-